tara:strand:- start:592 stop:903 length:312 start_codon:yes stop_codon:yes gene_type:complete
MKQTTNTYVNNIKLDNLKRLHFEWNINCPVDGEKNDYEEEHEVYDGVYEIDEKHNLIVRFCEYDETLCNYQSMKVVLKAEMDKEEHTGHILSNSSSRRNFSTG